MVGHFVLFDVREVSLHIRTKLNVPARGRASPRRGLTMPTRKLPLLSAPLTPCPCLPELHVMRAKRSLRRAADLLSVAGVPVAEATKVLARAQ
jgi:hypothetical protein